MTMPKQAFILVALAVAVLCQDVGDWKSQKKVQLGLTPRGSVSESTINYFGVMKENLPHFNEALKNILVPRTPGSAGSEAVRNFIVSELKNLEWDVEVDTFVEPNTIVGQQTFSNIIATLDPEAPRRLVVACHYDSKAEPLGFLGATDSAVPCSQMLNLAHTMHLDLAATKGRDVTLQFIFFDGEEAFKEWSSTDSIYGARNLAQKWSGLTYTHKGVSGNFLERIDMFVLLDLLGAKDPNIFSLNPSTQNWYQRLSDIENSLSSLNIVGGNKIFAGANNFPIEDDHIPFLRRGVNILHLIATPFPSVWHTLQDDASVVDLPTVEKLNKIFRIFIAEYLGLA